MSLRDYVTAKEGKPSVAQEYLDSTVPSPASIVLVQPTPQPVESAESAYRKLEESDHEDFAKGAVTAMEGLTETRHAIVRANARGGLSVESAYLADLTTQAYGKRLGLDEDSLSHAFESAVHNPVGKSVVSTETLDHALEAVDHSLNHLAHRAMSVPTRLFGSNWAGVKVSRSLVALIEKAATLTPSVSGAKITVKRETVSEGTTVSSNIAKSFNRLATDLVFIVGPFADEAKRDFDSNVTAVKHLGDKKTDLDQAVAKMPDVLREWKDPRSKLTAGIVGGSYIGNHRLFEDQELKYSGDNVTAKRFDELANLKYPVPFSQTGGSYEGPDADEMVEVPALTTAEIKSIAEKFQKAISAVSLSRVFGESMTALTGPLAPLFRSGAGKGVRGTVLSKAKKNGTAEQQALWTVRDALATSARLRVHVANDAIGLLLYSLGNFQKVAKLSLKAHGKATLEAYDNHNAVDGETVNETSPIEPTQDPIAKDLAPEGEVIPRKSSINDDPRTEQDLYGTAADDHKETVDGLTVVATPPAQDELAKASEGLTEEAPVAQTPAVKVVTAGKGRPYWLK